MKKRLLALALVLALALTFVACGAPAGGDSKKPVKIGLSTSISGKGAFIGEAAKAALEDYIVELNARGGFLGHPVELLTYDYGLDPAVEAVTTCNRMIEQDKVIAILGPFSSMAALPMADIVDAAKVPMITSASNVFVTVSDKGVLHPYVFRVCYIDPYLGAVMANYAYNEQGIRKVASMPTIGDAYSEGLAAAFDAEFVKLGGEIVASLGHQTNDVEFRAQITEAQSKGAEALFLPQSTHLIPSLVVNQAVDLGFNFKYLLGDAVYADELLEVAGPALEGAVLALGIYEKDPMFAEYKAAFAEKHPGNSANVFAMYALDAMMLLEWAVNESQSVDPVAIRDALDTAKGISLFTDKNFTIDPETHNPYNKTVNILEITNSTYNLIASFTPKDE